MIALLVNMENIMIDMILIFALIQTQENVKGGNYGKKKELVIIVKKEVRIYLMEMLTAPLKKIVIIKANGRENNARNIN